MLLALRDAHYSYVHNLILASKPCRLPACSYDSLLHINSLEGSAVNSRNKMRVDSRYSILVVELLLDCDQSNYSSRIAFYQRVSIASNANRWYSQRRHVRLSVCLSVTLRYCIKTKKARVVISSPSENLNILVSRNIWLITKFERGHPKRGRFMRLGWVEIGNFDDFSTNKPPYF